MHRKHNSHDINGAKPRTGSYGMSSIIMGRAGRRWVENRTGRLWVVGV